jgi:hypothetical protein
MEIAGRVVVVLALLAACSGRPERAGTPSTTAVFTSTSVVLVSSSSLMGPAEGVPAGFCNLAVRASGGSVTMDVDVDTNELVVFDGLSEHHRAMIRSAVADAAYQVRSGGGWDTTTFVETVNAMCGLHLTPITMTP